LFSIEDPDPGSGMGKKSGSGSGINNPNHISESLETISWVKILKFFEADPKYGMEKFGSGIRDPQHCFFAQLKLKIQSASLGMGLFCCLYWSKSSFVLGVASSPAKRNEGELKFHRYSSRIVN
jgi:hypothetical protein